MKKKNEEKKKQVLFQEVMVDQGKVQCYINKKYYSPKEVIPYEIIRPNIAEIIKFKYPNIPSYAFISNEEFSKFRKIYIMKVLKDDKINLSEIEKSVIDSLVYNESIVRNINDIYDNKSTIGERISDKIAEIGGSWGFVISFSLIMFFWILVNTIMLTTNAFDPFPFILLNLMLSTLAAFQAPIIMMSQNRKEARDRIREENDYKINLKSELEIRHLHEKIDNLTQNQWQRLLEIQQMQIDMIEQNGVKGSIVKKRKNKKK